MRNGSETAGGAITDEFYLHPRAMAVPGSSPATSSSSDEVQLAVQELRWSAYNTGALRSNEWQEVIVTEK